MQTEGDKQYVAIEPTSPNEIYVPYYEPAVVYGDWPYPDYAPYYFQPPYGYWPGAALATGIAFAGAVAVRHAFWGNCNWGGRYISTLPSRNVNIGNINNINRGRWEHNVDHRHGVRYNNADVRQKFAKTDIQAGREARQDFRGKDGQRVLDPGNRPGGGDRPGAGGDRPGAGPGGGDRPGAGERRPGGGDRPGAGGGRPGAGGDRPGAGAPKAGQLPAQKGGGQKAAQRPAQGGGQKAAQRPAQQPSQRPSQPRRDTAFSAFPIGTGRPPARRSRPPKRRRSRRRRAPRVRWRRPAAVGAAAAVVVVAAAAGGPMLRSSTTSPCSAISTTASAYYRFAYVGSDRAYVGVMAQEVQTIRPDAVVRGRDGYLRVHYDKLGLPFQTYDQWIASGARVPTINRVRH